MLCIVALLLASTEGVSEGVSEGVPSTNERFWHLLEKLDKYDELKQVTADHDIADLKQTFINNIDNEGEDEGEEMDSVINLMSKTDYEGTLTADLELTAGEEEDEEEEEEVADAGKDRLPESLDWRQADPPVLAPVINQGPCGSCGIISGTRVAESRMAIASGTYRAYSVQQQMNCRAHSKHCQGTFPPAIWGLMKTLDYQVDDAEMPYLNSRNKCGTNYVNCQCDLKSKENVFDDQLAFLGGTRSTGKSEEGMVQALQSGPVAICYTAQKGQNARNVTQCGDGRTCNHASIVVGYDKDFFFVQNSYGKNWGPLQGYWYMNRKSDCWTKQGSKFARYPVVWEDYDKTGAIFTEDSLDYSITVLHTPEYNTRTLGRAKKTCGLMGDRCQAIVQKVNKEYKLVRSLTPSDIPLTEYQTLYKKTQFIVRLYNEGTGLYLAVTGDTVMLAEQGTPFFLANGQFRVFTRPEYQLVAGPRLAKATDLKAQWGLRNCNLHNPHSGASLTMETKRSSYILKPNRGYSQSNLLQRFNLGLSSRWELEAAHRKQRVFVKKGVQLAAAKEPKNGHCFTWNARQIVSCQGGAAIRPDMWRLDDKRHSATDTQNTVQPKDCSLHSLDDDTMLNVQDAGQLGMASSLSPMGAGWTFQYQDI